MRTHAAHTHRNDRRGGRSSRAPDRRTRVELRIERLAAGGDGVGRGPDGRVWFVPDTAPGDRVRVRVVDERPRYVRGRVVTLLEAGADRVDPFCAVFGSCGGCSWQHVAYPAQLRAKASILTDALRRIGRLRVPEPIPIEPSPAPHGYRGRARVQVARGRVGFLRRHSHVLCATARCPVLVPALDAALGALARQPPGEDGEWELLAGADRVRAACSGDPQAAPIEVVAAGRRLRVSPGVFVQSNPLLLDVLIDAVARAAGRGALALELFAGAGFLTLPLAERFGRVLAVEGQPAAAADLRFNCRAAAPGRVEVLETSVGAALRSGGLPAGAEAAVLDPPRAGLGREAAEALARLAPRRIVALSCDAATLARDLAVLVRQGYALRAVRGFDLFPQTPHLEALALLEAPPP